jgi:hypothetical protein
MRVFALILGSLIVLVSPMASVQAPRAAAQQPADAPRITSFQEGRLPNLRYSGTTDAVLSETSPDEPVAQLSMCGVDGNEPTGTDMDRATLLRWDLTALPRNAKILGAFIILNVTDRSDHIYHLYALRQPWDEDQATWLEYRQGMNWSEPGARGLTDRYPVRMGSLRALETGPTVIVFNGDGLMTLRRWVADPSTNFGLIIDDTVSGDGIDFACSEALAAEERPILTVSYR